MRENTLRMSCWSQSQTRISDTKIMELIWSIYSQKWKNITSRALKVLYISKALDCWAAWILSEHWIPSLPLSLIEMFLLLLTHQKSWSHQHPHSHCSAEKHTIIFKSRSLWAARELQCAWRRSVRSDARMGVHQPPAMTQSHHPLVAARGGDHKQWQEPPWPYLGRNFLELLFSCAARKERVGGK